MTPRDTETAKTGKHVLLVDDYVDAVEIWSLLLEALGYTVATAHTGAGALERAAERVPDAIVLDLQLPDVSGSVVGRRLRDAAATRGVLLIALTGRELSREGLAELGTIFDRVLIKPCEPDDLIAALERPRVAASSHVAEPAA